MCLVSIILKEIRGGWIRKGQVLLFFMLRQLKTTASLRMGDEVAWKLAISKANLFRGSTKHSFYKKFLIFFWNSQRKTCVRVSFLKNSVTLKEDSGTSVFPSEFWNCLKTNFFCKMPSGHCFCFLKNHSETMQNLPLEC